MRRIVPVLAAWVIVTAAVYACSAFDATDPVAFYDVAVVTE